MKNKIIYMTATVHFRINFVIACHRQLLLLILISLLKFAYITNEMIKRMIRCIHSLQHLCMVRFIINCIFYIYTSYIRARRRIAAKNCL